MENLEELQNSLLDRVAAAGDLEALESLRVQALGKKGAARGGEKGEDR